MSADPSHCPDCGAVLDDDDWVRCVACRAFLDDDAAVPSCADCGGERDDPTRVRCTPCSDLAFERELTASPAWTRLHAASSRIAEAREQLRKVPGVRPDRARGRLDEALHELTVLGWEVDRLARAARRT